MPSDLTTLKALLGRQSKAAIRSGNWTPIVWQVTKTFDTWDLHIDSHQIGFAFSRAGRLLGIYNWKE